MNTSSLLARRGRLAATTALATAVLSLGLTGCGDGTSMTTGGASDDTSSTSSPAPSPSATTPDEPAATPDQTDDTETGSSESGDSGDSDDSGGSEAGTDAGSEPAGLSALGPRDPEIKAEFPGDMVFPDESSAYSDGMTLTVTTPAGERISADLPNNGGGYVSVRPVLLGDAGVGYVVTQTGGEYLDTFLAVLDQGELYYPEQTGDVVFGQFAGEGPFFETYSTDGGQHLVTHIEDAPSGAADEYYEWTVEDRRMVPTLIS